MTLTQGHDVFASLSETGVNKFIQNLALARPHYFNFATTALGGDGTSIGLLPPLTIPGANFGLNYTVQISPPKIDFYKQDVALPSPLVLKPNEFSVTTGAQLCIDIGSIATPPGPDNDHKVHTKPNLLCASFEVWAVGHPTVDHVSATNSYVGLKLDDVVVKNIGDLEPVAEFVASDVLNVLLEKARYLIKHQVFSAFAFFLADGPEIENSALNVWGTIG